MMEEEFLISTPGLKWIVSNKNHDNNRCLNKYGYFISCESALTESFSPSNGVLLYYKNEEPFMDVVFILIMLKIRYFWTDMSKEEFLRYCFVPNLLLFDDDTYQKLLKKFQLEGIKKQTSRNEFSNEQLKSLSSIVTLKHGQ